MNKILPFRPIFLYLSNIIKSSHKKYLCLIPIIGFIVYWNSFLNPFVWDDQWLIVGNPLIRSFKNIAAVFLHDIGSTIAATNSYRPIQIITYMADYHFWRLNPTGYHLVNVIIHILNAMLVYCLAYLVYKKPKIAFVASLFFTVHPIFVASVTYISGRADALACLFILLGLIAYIKYRDANSKKFIFFLISAACFLCALLSKELSIVFLLIVILYDISFKKERFKLIDCIKRYAFFLSIGFIYIFLRLTILNFSHFPYYLARFTLYERFIVFTQSVFKYIRILFFPFDVHMDRIVNISGSVLNFAGLISTIGIIGLLTLVIIAYRKSKILFFGSLWFFIFLLPQSGIYPINAFMADHFLYLPSIGFFLIMSYFIWKIPIKKIAIVVVSAFAILFSMFTIWQNKIWHDEERLYKHIIKLSPYSVQARNNLGFVYGKKNLNDQALEKFSMALKLCDLTSQSPTFYKTIYENIAN